MSGTTVDVSGAEQVGFVSVDRATKKLQMAGFVTLKKQGVNDVDSVQSACVGKNPYPFDPEGIEKSLFANPHHGTCLLSKVNSIVGQGFLSDEERKNGPTALNSEKVVGNPDVQQQIISQMLNPYYLPSEVDTTLDPLCEYSWNDALTNVGHDFTRSGNGYLEIARDPSDPIDGEVVAIWHMRWKRTKAFVESSDGRDWHWVYEGLSGSSIDGERHLAKWGDKRDFIERLRGGISGVPSDENIDPNDVNEVIHIRNPMALHDIYGYPDWLAAAVPIELISAMLKYKYDFFLNRGVPEYALFITGGKLIPSDWDKVVQAMNDQVGPGNSHKSFALNLPNSNIDIRVEKLGTDSAVDQGVFKDKESLSADIVTAHRTPPVLGNILIPGKLGSSNEFINSLMSYQLLNIGPAQRVFQQTLGSTLGDSEESGLGLSSESFILRKLTDLIDLGKADTVSRMRTELPQAKQEGRNLADGLQD